MQNVLGCGLSSEEIADIQRLAESAKTETVRDLLLRVASLSSSGNGIPSIAEDRTYTPAEAAKRIGMSRTHLYKLLDRGALPSHRVGSHRKIFASDLKAFEEKRHADRIELAERFSRERETAAAVDDEIADLL
ncbi:helix-turn-helix domain-containing protein [Corynebacterium casei]|uniref:DNA binding domain protein, excisionase family n=1 Tax=Corynebacterium casei UCMA 3821 TaxID=1110505 RepID=G7I0C6_9CORY|nr:helix-turn-helix domain-containing protein [Corynebacterium casei]MDN5729961.1 helix-turn-helix domain-containing protein [Corynebacterium casei]MDN5741529.1 helix-turn-helix domain-containing protein [Corynebacterium casei]MDN5785021.1 helix-turn-helix domain-containing protein [Corynebacterium casei]CCE55891.1 DNA binding domain protein, excisionase family [Corynebacterium casei UCMA 3821]